MPAEAGSSHTPMPHTAGCGYRLRTEVSANHRFVQRIAGKRATAHVVLFCFTDRSFPTLALQVCFFDMTADGVALGRIEMTLRADVTPKCAENFR
jgi:hypothetical protein